MQADRRSEEIIKTTATVDQPLRLFAEVPRELDEAAWIDGCSKMRALWKVVLPTVWAGLTTAGLLVGLAS
jgi:ABC-type glycerol-3-phosphate transport system permease component